MVVADEAGGAGAARFRHDRVQQAVLATMDDALRGGRQLAMARRLAGDSQFGDEAAHGSTFDALRGPPLARDGKETKTPFRRMYVRALIELTPVFVIRRETGVLCLRGQGEHGRTNG